MSTRRTFRVPPVGIAPIPPAPPPAPGPLPPGTIVLPIGFLIPRTVELAAQVLPGGGAFTPQGFSAIPAGTKRISYDFTYTGGAAAGYPAFVVQFTNGVTLPREMILDAGSLVPDSTLGAAIANIYMERLQNPSPVGGGATYVGVLNVTTPDNYTGVRLLVAEAGATATPGTIATAFTGAGGAGA